MSGSEFLRFLGIHGDQLEINNLEEIYMEIGGSIRDFIRGAASTEDVLSDNFLRPVTNRLKQLTEDMNLTNEELAQMVVDTGFILAIQGLTGETTLELFDGFKKLDEDSPAAQAVKRFLKAREDFVAAGIITRKELNAVGDDYDKIFNLFADAQQKFIEENKVTMQTVMDEFGVTEQAALKDFTMRMEEAFNKARESMVSLTQPLPENQFEDTSLIDLIVNAQNKARAQAEFEEVIKILRNRTPFLADILTIWV